MDLINCLITSWAWETLRAFHKWSRLVFAVDMHHENMFGRGEMQHQTTFVLMVAADAT